jgi:hypothetical protein
MGGEYMYRNEKSDTTITKKNTDDTIVTVEDQYTNMYTIWPKIEPPPDINIYIDLKFPFLHIHRRFRKSK